MVERARGRFRRLRPVPSFSAAHVFRPPRRDGAITPAVAATVAMVLALALVVRGAVRGISFASFTGDVLALLLLCLAFLFGYWAYAIYDLRYLVDDDALVIVWGTARQVVPVGQIDKIILGRKLGEPRVNGFFWPGCCVGRGSVERLGQVLFYSAHRSVADLVYVSTAEATFGLSLEDARGLARSIQAAQEHAGAGDAPVSVSYQVLPAQAILADRRALLLAGAALLVFLLAAGYLASRFQGLPPSLVLPFPPSDGPQRLGHRSELIRLPATALIWLLIGLAVAAWSHAKLRAVAYSVLAGTLFAECLYLVAAFAAAH